MPTTITPQDYTAFLAMIKHEGENGIANLLKQGRDGDALGYVSGLIDTWTNRASAAGLQPWQMMNRPSQITDWNTDTSWIQNKANSLPSNIKQLADAYLSARAEGAPQLNPGVNFYLNKDLVEATPAYGTKWKNWYDQSSVVNSFGDQRGGGRGSLQTQFVANPNEYQAKDTGIVFDKSLKVQPTDFGQGAYAKITGTASMGYDPARALNTGTTGLNTFDASEGAGPVNPGMVSDLGRPYETGNPFGFGGADVSSSVAPGFNNLGGAIPYGNVNPLAFAGNSNVGGGRPGAFTDFLPPVQTGDPFGFTGLDTGGGVGNGSFGNGIVQPGPAPDPFAFSGANMGGGVGAGSVGQLPVGFDPAAYLAANRDVAAAGVDPRQHYLNFGAQEGRSLGVPGLTPTQGPSGSASTLGPFDTASTLGNPFSTPTLGSGSTASTIGAPTGFDARSYIDANADIRALGFTPDQAVQHFRDYGQYEVRPLAPGQEARVHAAPGLSPTFGSGTTAPTLSPDGLVNVMSTGLTPTLGPNGFASTIGPGGTVPSFSPGGDTSYLTMPSTTATPFGPPDASSALPAGFDAMSYVAANPDLKALGFNGQQATQHFMDYGRFEARPLAPGMEARVYAPPGLTPTQGPTSTASTIGPGALTPTFGAPDLTSTIGPPALTGTYGPPATTPTIGAGNPVSSWSPFGGAGIGNPFSFSGANVGGGLGAGPQSFGSLWPVGSGVSEPAPAADPGSAGLGPFDFTNANVGGFDVNALGGGGGGGGTSGPNSVNDMGISGGFDSEGAMRRVLEQQAADLRKADQAAKTVMHSDPNAFNVAIANGGNTVGMGTALQTPGAIGGPVVPNLTVRNYATSAPGAMFSMFAPWR